MMQTFLNNTKEEFIKLMEFRQSIILKVKQLNEMQPTDENDRLVVDSQFFAYTAMLWEIDIFMEGLADDEGDKFNYINDDDYE